jgi:hypothetical protein
MLALFEADVHPLVVGAKVTPATLAGEVSTAHINGTDLIDKPGEVVCEVSGGGRVLLAGRRTGNPRLYRPRKRVSGTGLSNSHWIRHGK